MIKWAKIECLTPMELPDMKRRVFAVTHASSLVILLVLLLSSVQLSAQPCVDITDDKERLACFEGTISCSDLQTGTARLACFDKVISGRLQTKPLDAPVDVSKDVSKEAPTVGQSEPATRSQQTDQPAKKKSASDDFGKQKDVETPAEYIVSTIVEIKENGQRIDYLRLENGHIWRETEDHRVRFTVGQTVRIEKGVFGSFNLKLSGVKKLIKVKRVR